MKKWMGLFYMFKYLLQNSGTGSSTDDFPCFDADQKEGFIFHKKDTVELTKGIKWYKQREIMRRQI